MGSIYARFSWSVRVKKIKISQNKVITILILLVAIIASIAFSLPSTTVRTGSAVETADYIIFTDGTNWDPGEGIGIYYYNGTWNKLG